EKVQNLESDKQEKEQNINQLNEKVQNFESDKQELEQIKSEQEQTINQFKEKVHILESVKSELEQQLTHLSQTLELYNQNQISTFLLANHSFSLLEQLQQIVANANDLMIEKGFVSLDLREVESICSSQYQYLLKLMQILSPNFIPQQQFINNDQKFHSIKNDIDQQHTLNTINSNQNIKLDANSPQKTFCLQHQINAEIEMPNILQKIEYMQNNINFLNEALLSTKQQNTKLTKDFIDLILAHDKIILSLQTEQSQQQSLEVNNIITEQQEIFQNILISDQKNTIELTNPEELKRVIKNQQLQLDQMSRRAQMKIQHLQQQIDLLSLDLKQQQKLRPVINVNDTLLEKITSLENFNDQMRQIITSNTTEIQNLNDQIQQKNRCNKFSYLDFNNEQELYKKSLEQLQKSQLSYINQIEDMTQEIIKKNTEISSLKEEIQTLQQNNQRLTEQHELNNYYEQQMKMLQNQLEKSKQNIQSYSFANSPQVENKSVFGDGDKYKKLINSLNEEIKLSKLQVSQFSTSCSALKQAQKEISNRLRRILSIPFDQKADLQEMLNQIEEQFELLSQLQPRKKIIGFSDTTKYLLGKSPKELNETKHKTKQVVVENQAKSKDKDIYQEEISVDLDQILNEEDSEEESQQNIQITQFEYEKQVNSILQEQDELEKSRQINYSQSYDEVHNDEQRKIQNIQELKVEIADLEIGQVNNQKLMLQQQQEHQDSIYHLQELIENLQQIVQQQNLKLINQEAELENHFKNEKQQQEIIACFQNQLEQARKELKYQNPEFGDNQKDYDQSKDLKNTILLLEQDKFELAAQLNEEITRNKEQKEQFFDSISIRDNIIQCKQNFIILDLQTQLAIKSSDYDPKTSERIWILQSNIEDKSKVLFNEVLTHEEARFVRSIQEHESETDENQTVQQQQIPRLPLQTQQSRIRNPRPTRGLRSSGSQDHYQNNQIKIDQIEEEYQEQIQFLINEKTQMKECLQKDIENKEEEIDEMKLELDNLQQRLIALDIANNDKQKELEQLNQYLRKLDNQNQSLKNYNTNIENQLNTQLQAFENQRKIVENIHRTNDEIQKKYDILLQKYLKLEDDHNKLLEQQENDLAQINFYNESLKNMQDQVEKSKERICKTVLQSPSGDRDQNEENKFKQQINRLNDELRISKLQVAQYSATNLQLKQKHQEFVVRLQQLFKLQFQENDDVAQIIHQIEQNVSIQDQNSPIKAQKKLGMNDATRFFLNRSSKSRSSQDSNRPSQQQQSQIPSRESPQKADNLMYFYFIGFSELDKILDESDFERELSQQQNFFFDNN
ncbi:unnamed protein product, partial (macronuclear) [Paramecium tetraurelia]